jgi:hypothetical protein
VGRPLHERAWIANAFVSKVVLGITTPVGLIERLMADSPLRRICGFHLHKKLPSESTFSRAFDEFAQSALPERAHEALIKKHPGDELIGHLSRDSTAIEARERAARPVNAELEVKRSVKRQRGQTLDEMHKEIPTACDRGSKKNQAQLAGLQTAPRYRRLRRSHCRFAQFSLNARQPRCDSLVPAQCIKGDESLRCHGRGLYLMSGIPERQSVDAPAMLKPGAISRLVSNHSLAQRGLGYLLSCFNGKEIKPP